MTPGQLYALIDTEQWMHRDKSMDVSTDPAADLAELASWGQLSG